MYGNFSEFVSRDLDELIDRLSQPIWHIPDIDLDWLQNKDNYWYAHGASLDRVVTQFDEQQWRAMISNLYESNKQE